MTTMDQEKLGELLSAYLDGELDDQQVQWVESLIQENETARSLLNDLQQTAQLVSTLPRQSAPASIADDLQLHLERDELLGEPGPSEPVVRKSRISIKPILSIAAMILVVVSATLWMARDHTPFAKKPGGDVFALAEREESTRLNIGHSMNKREDSLRRNQDTDLTDGLAESAGQFASTDMNTMLEVGTDVQAIQLHSFSNETLRLKINTKNAKERNEMAARLVTHLSNRHLKDISKSTRRTKMNQSNGGFYYQGEPSINFIQKDQTQILVRLPVREIDRLLDEISQIKDIDDRVAVAAGPLIFRGLDQTRSTLQSLDFYHTNSKKTPYEIKRQRNGLRKRSSRTSIRDDSDRHKANDEQTRKLFIDLLDVVGMDTAIVDTMFRENSEKPLASDGKGLVIKDNSRGQSTTNIPMTISTTRTDTQVGTLKLCGRAIAHLRSEELRARNLEPHVTFVIELQIENPKSPPNTSRPTPRKPVAKKSKSNSKAQ